MATHSSILAWRIPGMGEASALPSVGLHRVGHDWSYSAAAAGCKQRHYFANKGPSSQTYGFSSSHVWIWELDYKESWVLKNWCFWTVVLETTLQSERVTGRKARGLQMEEIACKCQTFLSLLRGRRKLVIFFPSLYKFKRRFLLKYRVAIMTPGFTWS